MSKTLRIFGCGGAGINLVSPLFGNEQDDTTANIIPTLVDASESNLRGNKVPQESTYLIRGLDGAGQIRAENYHDIDKEIRQVLVQHEPAELREGMNVIVYSASGGSGSVIGPLLVRELSERGLPVISLVVGDDSSFRYADNTLKTLQSLDKIAHITGVPALVSFTKNDGGRTSADQSIATSIGCLAVLFSGKNNEMDSMDLVHWMNYTKHTGDQAQLAGVHIAISSDQFERITAPISIASLYNSTSQAQIKSAADYHTTGYTDLSRMDFNELHFVIGIDDITAATKEFQRTVSKLQEARDARVKPERILDDANGQSTDRGLIL